MKYSSYQRTFDRSESWYYRLPRWSRQQRTVYGDVDQTGYAGWSYPKYKSASTGPGRSYTEWTGAFDSQSALNAYSVAQSTAFTAQSALNAYTTHTADFIAQAALNAYKSQVGEFVAQSGILTYSALAVRFNTQSAISVYAGHAGTFTTQATLNAYQAATGSFTTQSSVNAYTDYAGTITTQTVLNAYKTYVGTQHAQSALIAYQPTSAVFNSVSAIAVFAEASAIFNAQTALNAYQARIVTFNSQSALSTYTEQSATFNTQSTLNAYTAAVAEFTTQSALDATEKFYAWALNLTTGAVSKFDNFNFNRVHNGRGSNSDGIHDLYGDTDNGAAINGFVESGKLEFKDGNEAPITVLKRVTDTYIGFTGGKLTLTAATDNCTVEYPVQNSPTLGTSKIDMARGAKGRYWSVKIANKAGSQANVNDIDVLFETLSRRV
jgi:hypothetical protein